MFTTKSAHLVPMAMLFVIASACTVSTEAPLRGPSIEPSEVSCDASEAQGLVGRRRGPAAEAEAKRVSGAGTVRWIAPIDGVTADFDTGRINLETDARGRIVAVRCG